jgi:hypothetical protein
MELHSLQRQKVSHDTNEKKKLRQSLRRARAIAGLTTASPT